VFIAWLWLPARADYLGLHYYDYAIGGPLVLQKIFLDKAAPQMEVSQFDDA